MDGTLSQLIENNFNIILNMPEAAEEVTGGFEHEWWGKFQGVI